MRRPAAVVGLTVLAAVLSLHAQNPPASPPTPSTGTALITGRVVDAESGAPVASTVVTLSGRGQTPAQANNRVLTDAQGRFFFSDLPPGTVNLAASKPGYLPGAFGQKRPQGRSEPIDIGEGGRRNDITISLWRYATISGRVVDEAGDPFVGVDVRIVQQQWIAGHRQVTLGARAVTDDRGMYRFSTLTPNDYLVVVPASVTTEPATFAGAIRAAGETPRAYLQSMAAVGSAPIIMSDRAEGLTGGNRSLVLGLAGIPSIPPVDAAWLTYPTTFLPAATSIASATVVRAVAGRDMPLADIVLRLVPTFQVSGTVSGADGPAAFHGVHLLSADSADLPLLDAATAVTDANGAFTFYGVPAGSYVARVVRTPYPSGAGFRMGLGGSGQGPVSVLTFGGGPNSGPPPMPTEPLLHASVPVTVADRHVRDVSLVLRAGPRVSGRAEFDGTSPRPSANFWKAMLVRLEPANGRPDTSTGQLTPEGLFTTPSLWPGRYLIRVPFTVEGWTLKSVTAGGRDVSETPIDITADLEDVVITFTDKPVKIEGTVQTTDGQSGSESVVLMFPSDPAAWADYGVISRRIRTINPSAAGAFSVPAPPAGEYLLIAVPEGSTDWLDWLNPAVMARIAPLADRVQVRDGQPTTCTLKVKRVPQ
jgi:hypothetical protein